MLHHQPNGYFRNYVARRHVALARNRTWLVPRAASSTATPKLSDAEAAILDALKSAKGRGKEGLSASQLSQLNAAVELLEADGGVAEPVKTPAIDGMWRLLYTSRPGSASPIQRTFTGVDAFSVFQVVSLAPGLASALDTSSNKVLFASDQTPRVTQPELCTCTAKQEVSLAPGSPARCNNVVVFGSDVGYLKVEAEASTDARPLPGFTPREGEGLPFGIMGKSMTHPPARRNMRIDFQFDRAAFYFKKLPFTIPYPVPFRLLGDERKGWVDITYLSPSGAFRLSRGNKGTLFILVKDSDSNSSKLQTGASGASSSSNGSSGSAAAGAPAGPPAGQPAVSPRPFDKAGLLAAIRAGDNATVVAMLASQPPSPVANPAQDGKAVSGKWRLVWSQQAANASPLQKFGSSQSDSWQIIDAAAGMLQNLVHLGPFVKIKAAARCQPASGVRTTVEILEAGISLFDSLRIPLPVPRGDSNPGWVEWLWLDQDVRITRGSKGSTFIHVREAA